MVELPPVVCIIPTYNRPKILTMTVHWLTQNLRYDGKIIHLIGNDGEEIPHFYSSREFKVIPGPKKGLGANLNMLLREAAKISPIVLQMDDDHHLLKPLDITQYVKDLLSVHGVGWVRLFLGTEKDLNNDDPFYQFSAKMQGRYWWPAPGVDELYIPSNRPHLKLIAFHDVYGFYRENLKMGEGEVEFCHRYADKHITLFGQKDHHWVVIPVAAPSFDTWDHVGDSWQKEGF